MKNDKKPKISQQNSKEELSQESQNSVPSVDPELTPVTDTPEIGVSESNDISSPIPVPQAAPAPPVVKKTFPFIFTGKELLNMNITTLPLLLDPFLPKTGVVALAGSSDTGKSSILRQLAVDIATGEATSLGFPIYAAHKRAIYVSSEDDRYSIAFLLQKQMVNEEKKALYDNLAFIFNTENLIPNLESVLKKNKVDAIFIDTMTDIFEGDLNQTNKIRFFLNKFSNLAEKNKCLIVFLHHTGKRTEQFPPSKDNLLGSQGFEAKMRMVIELRRDFTNPKYRHLCIVKGNYLPESFKQQSFVFEFDDNMRFTNLNQRVPFEKLARRDPGNPDRQSILDKAISYRDAGLSVTKIVEKLNAEGINVARSTVGKWVKDNPVVIIGYGYADDTPPDFEYFEPDENNHE
jgi:hypothetical protein